MADQVDVPEGMYYTEDHEWVRLDGDTATVGITDHAQGALGDITYVELPPVGDKVNQFEELAAVESAKAAADVYSPISGTVSEVNTDLEDSPEIVNEDPYGEGWICRLSEVEPGALSELLTAEQYRELLERETQ